MMISLFPSRCLLCHVTTLRAVSLCDACEQDLPYATSACLQCGEKLYVESITPIRCGSCLKDPPPFDRVITAFFYEPPLSHLITDLKFHNALCVAKLLSYLLAKKLQLIYTKLPLPACIIPMPLHRSRLRARGYNQAFELSRSLANTFRRPIRLHTVERIIATQAQSLLSATERVRNIKNAFRMKKNLSEKHVAIVDDVITTGCTVAELSHTLRQAGVTKIDVWCCAKAQN